MVEHVPFRVGNTYKEIPHRLARLSRNGRHRLIHEWELYVEILPDQGGDPDVIASVIFDLGTSFYPQSYVCTCPVPAANGAWRFVTKQQSYGFPNATITVRGRGGTRYDTTYVVEAYHAEETVVHTLEEARTLRPWTYVKLAESQKFGIELELSSSLQTEPRHVADWLTAHAGVGPVLVLVDQYGAGRSTRPEWKLVPDASIACSPSQPDCHKFELVSPILQGGEGLSQVHRVLKALQNVSIKVNKSMGFHVHMNVEQLSLAELIKVCQNFVKYEDVMDSFLPPSRRTGSDESNQYFQSNRQSVGRSSNKDRHTRMAHCHSLGALAHVMNGDHTKYYKLNLQNLKSGRQPTLEFRQHSATVQYHKVNAWIRFCSALVLNSARLASPRCFARHDKPLEDQFDCLFHYVIKDRGLREFYRERQEQVETNTSSGDAAYHECDECAQTGGTCCANAAKRLQ